MRQRSKKRLSAAVLAISGIFVAACNAGGQSAADSAVPVSGGTLTYGIDVAPLCFDIHASTQDITAEIQRNVFDSLVSEDDHHDFHPWLATSWTVSPDGRSYTFKLRTDVTFSDGTPFTAQAVKLNFDHIVAPTTKSQYAASLLGPYTGTEVLDDHTAKVTFSRPFVPFLQAASTAYLGFYSPKALADNAGQLCAGGPANVGTGPFVFTSYTKGQSVVLTRNPKYAWPAADAKHAGPAYLDSVVFRILPEDATRVGALVSGQLDVAKAIPPVQVKAMQANAGVELLHVSQPGEVYSVYLNTTSAPLDDIRVRQAIQAGVNVAQDVQTVYFGQYARAWSPLSPSTPGYNGELADSVRYDPTRAGQLLDEAGWTGRDAQGFRTRDGKRLSLFWPALPTTDIREQRGLLAQAVQADLTKLGFEINHPNLTVGEYSSKAVAGQFQLLDLSWVRAEPDVLRLFFNSASKPPAGDNASMLADADVDKWTNDATATQDPKARDALYAQVQERVVQLGAVVPMYVLTAVDGVARNTHGVIFDPNGWLLFHDAWKA